MLYAGIAIGACLLLIGLAASLDVRALRNLVFVTQSVENGTVMRLRAPVWAASIVWLLCTTWWVHACIESHGVVVSAEGAVGSACLLYLTWQFGVEAFNHACWALSGENSTAALRSFQGGILDRLHVCRSVTMLTVLMSALVPLAYLLYCIAATVTPLLRAGATGVQVSVAGAAEFVQSQPPSALAAAGLALLLLLAWLRERASTAALSARVTALQEDGVGAAERDRMRLASYPDSFPSGWYRVCDSAELRRGEMRTVRMLGLELVVFRAAESGVASVLGAFCPHLGAHLGIGGRVVGDCIECPFHRWQFDTAGCVAHVPYCDAPPTGAHAHANKYDTREYYGWVMMWYDAEDPGATTQRGSSAQYDPPLVPDVDDGTLVFRGSTSPPNVRMHIQEFAENSADPQHFQPLHDRAYFPYTSIPIPFMEVVNKTRWEGPAAKMSPDAREVTVEDGPGDDGKRRVNFAGPMIAAFRDTIFVRILGTEIPAMTAKADITFVGPGGLSFFRFDIPNVGFVHMFQAMTPLGLMRQRVDFRFFAPAGVPTVLVHYVVGNWIQNFRADVAVWENKVFAQRPLLAKGDGPIMRMRAWVSQFYSKSKPKRSIAFEADTVAPPAVSTTTLSSVALVAHADGPAGSPAARSDVSW